MKHFLFTLVLIVLLAISAVAIAAERYVWAPQGDVAFFEENGKIGLQTVEGQILHEAAFDEVSYFFRDGQANVTIGNTMGRIDKAGKIVVTPFECTGIGLMIDSIVENQQLLIISQEKGGKSIFGLATITGVIISEPQWEIIQNIYNGFVFAMKDKKWYRLDMEGNFSPDRFWDQVTIARDGSAVAETKEEKVYFASTGEVVARLEMTEDGETYRVYWNEVLMDIAGCNNLRVLGADVFAVKQGKNWRIVNQGNLIQHEPLLVDIKEKDMPEGLYYVIDENNDAYWIDKFGIMVSQVKWKGIGTTKIADERWHVGIDELNYILDSKGQVVFSVPDGYEIWGVHEGYLRYTVKTESDYNWGYMNAAGEILCAISSKDFQWAEGVLNPYSDGYTRISSSTGEVGYMDVYGNMILFPEKTSLYDFSYGLAFVSGDGEWISVNDPEDGAYRIHEVGKFGIIDKTGNFIQEHVWHAGSEFFKVGEQLIAQVRLRNEIGEIQYGYVNSNGEPICGVKMPIAN